MGTRPQVGQQYYWWRLLPGTLVSHLLLTIPKWTPQPTTHSLEYSLQCLELKVCSFTKGSLTLTERESDEMQTTAFEAKDSLHHYWDCKATLRERYHK